MYFTWSIVKHGWSCSVDVKTLPFPHTSTTATRSTNLSSLANAKSFANSQFLTFSGSLNNWLMLALVWRNRSFHIVQTFRTTWVFSSDSSASPLNISAGSRKLRAWKKMWIKEKDQNMNYGRFANGVVSLTVGSPTSCWVNSPTSQSTRPTCHSAL